MSLRDRAAAAVHRTLCGTRTPRSEDGCCGCGAAVADVYITVGCDHCGASGEPYCWPCVDTWPDTGIPITMADLTMFPGHER